MSAPFTKSKGDPLTPQNYRPITILSCTGKLFTSVTNKRLTRFLNENDLLSEMQTGFRKDCTIQRHMISLNQIL